MTEAAQAVHATLAACAPVLTPSARAFAARGHQLASVLEALAHGTFAGATWQNGAFHVSKG